MSIVAKNSMKCVFIIYTYLGRCPVGAILPLEIWIRRVTVFFFAVAGEVDDQWQV